MGPTDASDSRLALLRRWVFEDLGFFGSQIAPASTDASFRRYFRVTRGADSYIAMDAPPGKEDLGPFLKVARLLAGIGLNVPMILAQDPAHGFLLLSDLGVRHYLDELTVAGAADRLYGNALRALSVMQTAVGEGAGEVPRYSHALLIREMELMPEWFLKRHLRLAATSRERAMLAQLFESLAQSALAQPHALVHRDYHSRNLLLSADNDPGIIDFQDAVWGPVTYDAVSLLKDCYIAWPASQVRDWALQHRERLLAECVLTEKNGAVGASGVAAVTEAQYLRWFDLMGLQRHIKVLGIFARLHYRDGKAQYLQDLPRTLHYTKTAAALYPETAQFALFLDRRIEPLFAQAQQRTSARALS